jgi:probable rRNA maturation factor
MTRVPVRAAKKVPSVSIVVAEPRWRADPSVVRLMRKALRLALASEPPPDHASGRTPPAVTILLADDRRLRGLNAFFRGKDQATNVLSFSPGREDAGYLGDIALGFGVVTREARAQRKSLAEHTAHLAIHGLLHLIGYDHEKANEAELMEAREIALLEQLGIADPYRPRAYTKRRKKALN